MKISFIMPGRNNLKYAKWSYDSIQKNKGDHEVEICFADDASTDGTWEWASKLMETDPNFKAIRNDSGVRLGHTILYDRLVNEVATAEVCMIWHCDMYLCPGALDAIEKYMVTECGCRCHKRPHMRHMFACCHNGINYSYKTIVSLTRIEPPLHPPGPEKLLADYGIEPENFDEERLLKDLHAMHTTEKITEGVFAPWAFFKKDFQEIGGHDPLYAPQSKEDSDIFNRFQLNGVKFIQTWGGLVYHMTCRGSRYNPTITTPGTDSDEWKKQNIKSARNFVRKWGHFVRHDEYMKPIIPHKYDVGLVIKNVTLQGLYELEPWYNNVYVDVHKTVIDSYISYYQPDTKFDLSSKIKKITEPHTNDILVYVDWNDLHISSNTILAYLTSMLSDIITDSGVEGETMELGPVTFKINKLHTYERDLIICKK